ncbi:ATP-binding protein [Streptomyces sp. NPDC005125]
MHSLIETGLDDPDDTSVTCDLRFDAHPRMVGVVRKLLRAALSERDSDDFAETACLLATEIVSNALLHAGRSVRVRVRDDGCVLSFAADDDGSGFQRPTLRQADDEAEGGRGLLLVDACATRWGQELLSTKCL